jgi:ribosomal protein S18 acetylase RimI-like enzyme
MPLRPYGSPDDLQLMLEALMAWRAQQPAGDYFHVGDLLWMLRHAGEPERTIRLWEEDGYLLGFVTIDLPGGELLIQVSPSARDSVQRELFAWGVRRLDEASRCQGTDKTIWMQAGEDNLARIASLEAEGFKQSDQRHVELVRPLDTPVDPPHLPPGFTVRAFRDEQEVEAYVDLHRDAWSVWAPSTYSVEQHLRLMRHPGYVRELTPVAVAPDGRLAAYCIGWLDEVNKIGEIEPLGTRPAYTGMGLARAIVVEALRRMRNHGMETALVYASTNNDRAWKVYESSGFRPARTIYNYHRRIP